MFYNSSNQNVATIVDGKIHIINSGTSTITASQSGDNVYTPAKYSSKVLTVTEGELSINAFNTQNTITYSPNPVISYLTLHHTTPMLEAKVYNLLGEVVLKSHFNTTNVKIDFSALPQSLYYVSIKTLKGKEIIKTIKK